MRPLTQKQNHQFRKQTHKTNVINIHSNSPRLQKSLVFLFFVNLFVSPTVVEPIGMFVSFTSTHKPNLWNLWSQTNVCHSHMIFLIPWNIFYTSYLDWYIFAGQFGCCHDFKLIARCSVHIDMISPQDHAITRVVKTKQNILTKITTKRMFYQSLICEKCSFFHAEFPFFLLKWKCVFLVQNTRKQNLINTLSTTTFIRQLVCIYLFSSVNDCVFFV